MSGVEEATDQQLVDQVMAGNKNAYQLLAMRYQHRVAALIARFVQDPQEVDDVATSSTSCGSCTNRAIRAATRC